MSALESFVWHFLGYAAIPTIFIVGFLITAVVGCFLLEALGRGEGQ
jgi:uncharacterized protein (TIGR02808 family)